MDLRILVEPPIFCLKQSNSIININNHRTQESIDMSRPPIHTIRMCFVKAAIWRNETKVGTRHQVTICRLFKNGDMWQESTRFGRDDLPLAAKILELAMNGFSSIAKKAKETPEVEQDSMPNNSTILLSSREAAKRLSISERTLWTLTDRGEIRCIRMGTAKRYPIIELERFIERKLLEQIDPLANPSWWRHFRFMLWLIGSATRLRSRCGTIFALPKPTLQKPIPLH